jgi:hypothetical protein
MRVAVTRVRSDASTCQVRTKPVHSGADTVATRVRCVKPLVSSPITRRGNQPRGRGSRASPDISTQPRLTSARLSRSTQSQNCFPASVTYTHRARPRGMRAQTSQRHRATTPGGKSYWTSVGDGTCHRTCPPSASSCSSRSMYVLSSAPSRMTTSCSMRLW